MNNRDERGALSLDEQAAVLLKFPNMTRDVDLTAYMDETIEHQVKPATSYRDALIKRLISREEHDPAVTPLPFNLLRGKFEFRPHELTIWSGFKGHGKALCLNTDIPTPDGWKTMGDIVPGDRVFDENGKPCNVVAVTGVMTERPCYKVVFSDGTEIIADENHQWLTENSNTRGSIDRQSRRQPSETANDQRHKCLKPSLVTTGEIANTLRSYVGTKAETLNHAVRVCGPVLYCEEDQPLPVAPYVLGAWLGDGNSDGAAITTADAEMVQSMEDAGHTVTKRAAKYLYGLNGGLLQDLRKLDLINNKHIPSMYMRASVDARLALLQGLMDTDGSATEYGRCEFSNTNIDLAEQVFELICSLGIKAKTIKTRATLNGKDCGECHRITFTTKAPVFRLTRKLDRQMSGNRNGTNERRFIVSCDKTDSVPVRCIQVDSHSNMYLATRSFIPTHNSLMISQALMTAIKRGKKIFVVSPEFRPEGVLERLLYQFAQTTSPTPEHINEFMSFVTERMWLYDAQASLKPKVVIALCRYAADTLDVQHIVIDSLMKCGMAPDDYGAQKNFVDQVQSVAHKYPLHIHLVAHARKGNDDSKPPKLHDVKGASEIADMPENVLCVWRNKEKEKSPDQKHSEPDASLTVEAQRNGDGWIGHVNLMYDSDSQLFFEPGNKPEGSAYVRF